MNRSWTSTWPATTIGASLQLPKQKRPCNKSKFKQCRSSPSLGNVDQVWHWRLRQWILFVPLLELRTMPFICNVSFTPPLDLHCLGREVAVFQERTRRRRVSATLALQVLRIAWAVGWGVEALVVPFLLPVLWGKAFLVQSVLYTISLNYLDVVLLAVCISQLSQHHRRLHLQYLFPLCHNTSNTFDLRTSTLQLVQPTQKYSLSLLHPQRLLVLVDCPSLAVP